MQDSHEANIPCTVTLRVATSAVSQSMLQQDKQLQLQKKREKGMRNESQTICKLCSRQGSARSLDEGRLGRLLADMEARVGFMIKCST